MRVHHEKKAMRCEFTIRESDGERADHERKSDGVRVHHKRKSDGLRVHRKKERWGES